ncbi:hypothetical protein HX033_15980 [Myroides odoratimimus]|uniref:hypothetical protein n=1 Tax=Myroides odoratimimus TaxID=76832 RepID=UPI002575410A|nr:hypothetical protein [Myroides odoratimimus]MDM1402171.1 hypothetical protein [Myroides odoratimimus]MEC4036597.1 hypothetical protein [Myroides odoratimimus]
MATINGFIRSYGAAVRRSERDQQRRNREAAKKFKEQQKQLEFQNVAQAVSEWNNYVQILKSVHKEASEKIDWIKIKNEPRPTEPIYINKNEIEAKQRLASFKPNLLDKIFGSTNKKIKNLESQILIARKKDKDKYQIAVKDHKKELLDWEELHKIAIGIEQKQTEAYLAAIEYFEPFSEISELGSQIKFMFEENHIEIDINTNSIDVIPNYELRQTSTGKLSKKDMSKTNYYELYQDHICSVVLRISREAFAYLPIDFAIINALSEMVDSQSGHLENKVILSVKIIPETIEKLNLEMLDPSDSMRNFIHNMNFKKTLGFQEVQKIQ